MFNGHLFLLSLYINNIKEQKMPEVKVKKKGRGDS